MTSFSSIFTTGVSGLNAFSSQLSNISENIANTSTIGFKVVDTNFTGEVAGVQSASNAQGFVAAKPVYRTGQQGVIENATQDTAIAINGAGYLPVASPFVSISATGAQTTTFSGTTQYTRDGDFSVNASGYLVNGAGNYLQGVAATNGAFPTTAATATLAPIKVDPAATSPAVATTTATTSLIFPANASAGTTYNQSISIFDSTGTAQTIPLTWTKLATPANGWSIAAGSPLPSGVTGVTATNAQIDFNTDGSLAPGSAGAAAGGSVAVGLSIEYTAASGAASPQSVSLALGTAATGATPGATGYTAGSGSLMTAATALQTQTLTVDGNAQGTATGLSINDQGILSQTFSNGKTTPIYRIPIATFANPEGLQRLSGTLFDAVPNASGAATVNWAGSNGAGGIEAGRLETSTVDTSTEFTKMIVAQRAYSANSKTVSTADELTQTLLGIAR